MTTAERDALIEAVADTLHRYEAADEHNVEHYRVLRQFLGALEQEPV
jgi:hypothetical protein